MQNMQEIVNMRNFTCPGDGEINGRRNPSIYCISRHKAVPC